MNIFPLNYCSCVLLLTYHLESWLDECYSIVHAVCVAVVDGRFYIWNLPSHDICWRLIHVYNFSVSWHSEKSITMITILHIYAGIYGRCICHSLLMKYDLMINLMLIKVFQLRMMSTFYSYKYYKIYTLYMDKGIRVITSM